MTKKWPEAINKKFMNKTGKKSPAFFQNKRKL